MKKIVFALILMVGIGFTMTSCTKGKSLEGTTWVGTKYASFYTANMTLSFHEFTYTMDERDSDGDFFTTTSNYTYDAPNVTLIYNGESVSGTVSGNKLSLAGIAFTKQ